MQANYPKKLQRPHWDPVNINYPIKKQPTTGVSSETIGREWQTAPEVLPSLRAPVYEEREYMRDYNVTRDLTRSQSTLHFGHKISEERRFTKHSSCNENEYIYQPTRRLRDRTPKISVHETSEMKSSFPELTIASRLVTDKDQFKHPSSLLPAPIETERNRPYHKELEPLDTTHDGFEKYLDPYLTTSRLHHRPFTVEQLNKPSNSRNVLTYYTLSDTLWVRSPKPNTGDWRVSPSKAKSVYDREKFKNEFREIRTHKRPKWIPSAFRTENNDNYVNLNQTSSQIHNCEEEVRSLYQRSVANLRTTTRLNESNSSTESSQVGSRKPICAVIDQHAEKNKRLK